MTLDRLSLSIPSHLWRKVKWQGKAIYLFSSSSQSIAHIQTFDWETWQSPWSSGRKGVHKPFHLLNTQNFRGLIRFSLESKWIEPCPTLIFHKLKYEVSQTTLYLFHWNCLNYASHSQFNISILEVIYPREWFAHNATFTGMSSYLLWS